MIAQIEEIKIDKFYISRLYYRYGKTSDENIRKYLEKIKIAKEKDKGIDTIQGYYPLSEESMAKIKEKPRSVSLTSTTIETSNEILVGLKPWKDIIYLVKSTSSFFFRPDVGEILDQIHFRDLHDGKIKGIVFNPKPQVIISTGYEDFLMRATLMRETLIVREKKT